MNALTLAALRLCLPSLAVIGLTAVTPAGALAAPLMDFFAGQGCTIGPASRKAAIAAGFSADQIDTLARTEATREGAAISGDWITIAPAACTIRPPEIASVIALNDPDVVAAISAPDAYLDQDSPGCFLGAGLMDQLTQSRGWDADTAFDAYIRLIGSGIISGNVSFYANSPLITPPGHYVTTGACADIPAMPDIRRSHAFLMQNFDPLVRGVMAANDCADGIVGLDTDPNTRPGIAPGTTTSNAWTDFEIQMIGIAAGWQPGATATARGVPRPPLCHLSAPPQGSRAEKRKARRE